MMHSELAMTDCVVKIGLTIQCRPWPPLTREPALVWLVHEVELVPGRDPLYRTSFLEGLEARREGRNRGL